MVLEILKSESGTQFKDFFFILEKIKREKALGSFEEVEMSSGPLELRRSQLMWMI